MPANDPTRDRLRIAVQKSGRLGTPARELLAACGLTWRESRDKLFFFGQGLAIDLLLVRDDDIPGLLADGIADLGIVGRNVLAESQLARLEPEFTEVRQLGFGPCELDLAVPSEWEWEGPAQLEGMRIATSYPQLTRDWLTRESVDAEVVTLSGSVEIAPSLGQADVVSDLVSSGATLRANSLRPVATLLESEAVLAATTEPLTGPRAELADLLLRRLDGVRRVADSKVLMAQVPADRLSAVVELLPDAEEPTITPVVRPSPSAGEATYGQRQEDGSGVGSAERSSEYPQIYAVQALCHGAVTWAVLEDLKAAGARSLMVLPVEGMLV